VLDRRQSIVKKAHETINKQITVDFFDLGITTVFLLLYLLPASRAKISFAATRYYIVSYNKLYKTHESESIYPASLLRDPFGDLFHEYEVHYEADDARKEANLSLL
jgi:hypothetical protein